MKVPLPASSGSLTWVLRTALIAALLLAFGGAGSASAEMATSVGVASFSDSPDPVRVGEELTYTYVVRNSGSATADEVAVHTGVGPTVEFVSSGFSKGSKLGACPPDELGHITCHVGDLGADEEATLTVVVRPRRLGYLENVVPHLTVGGFGQPSIDEFFSTVVLPPERCTIVGTEGVDDLVGTSGRDVICAFGGDDSVRGRGGGDEIYAGDGRDTVSGTHARDTIYGGYGEDRVSGFGGDDQIRGGPGSDTLQGDGNPSDDGGADDLYGGPGVDSLRGGLGPDRLYGGDRADVIRARDGVNGNDEAYGGWGKDTISVDPGDRVKH